MKALKRFFAVIAVVLATVFAFAFVACDTNPPEEKPNPGIGDAGNTGDSGNTGDTGDNGDNGDGGDEDGPRVLTREQVYTAYKNVGLAMSGEDKVQVADVKNGGRNAQNQRAGDEHKYELLFESKLSGAIADCEPVEGEYDMCEFMLPDSEFALYYRVAEYCSAQDGFELDKWHYSDTSDFYCYGARINLWYDDDYIYFCFAVKIRSAEADPDEGDVFIFSYSTLDYDYESGDFYCRVYVGETVSLDVEALKDSAQYKLYEIAYENNAFYGYLDGAYFSRSGPCYDFGAFRKGEYDEYYEGERYGETIENGLTAYFAAMRPDTAGITAVAEKLPAAVEDEFARNYFMLVLNGGADPENFRYYQEECVKLLDAFTDLPAGPFKTYLDAHRDEWEQKLTEIKNAELSDWVYVSPHLINDEVCESEILRAPKIISKSWDDRAGEWGIEYEMSILDLFCWGSWDNAYVDEECTQPLTVQAIANFVFGESVVYQKWNK